MSLIRPEGNKRVRKTSQENEERLNISRLEGIKEEMLELLNEADHLLKGAEGMVYDRAKSYWIPHVIMAITKEHEYLGGSMVTMEDTIEELREQLPGGPKSFGPADAEEFIPPEEREEK